MMFADLVDLQDLSDKLKELGVVVPQGATQQKITELLKVWLNSASQEEMAQFETLVTELRSADDGLVLPAVLEVLQDAWVFTGHRSDD